MAHGMRRKYIMPAKDVARRRWKGGHCFVISKGGLVPSQNRSRETTKPSGVKTTLWRGSPSWRVLIGKVPTIILMSSDKALPTTMGRGIHDSRTVRDFIRSRVYLLRQRQVFT